MRFRTFVQRMMLLPAQVLTTGLRLVVRLLDRNPWRHVFFRAIEAVRITAQALAMEPEHGCSGPP